MWKQSRDIRKKSATSLSVKGKALAEEKKCRMTAVVIGSDIDAVIGEAAAYGADQIIAVDAPVYEYYSTDGYAVTMTELIRKYRPETVRSVRLIMEEIWLLALRVRFRQD